MRLYQNEKSAFTLIELLVVISIIAVLMAVMIPALRKAKEQAMTVVCSTQHKDIGMALNLYAQDWEGSLPRAHPVDGDSGKRLPYRLAPYYDRKTNVGSAESWSYELYHCPGQPKYLVKEDGSPVERGKGAVGAYGYNHYFYYGLNPGGQYGFDDAGLRKWKERNMSDIKDGANLPLHGCLSGEKPYSDIPGSGGHYMSYAGPHPKALKYGFMGGKTMASAARVNRFGLAPNHGKNANILMGDFSVRPVNVCVDGDFPWTDYYGTNFHPSRSISRNDSKYGDKTR